MSLSRRFSAPRLLFPAVAGFLLSIAAASARADSLQDASKLLKQGQPAQALEQVDKFLAGKPKDAQGRFLKGLILTEMNRSQDAVAVFSKLTEDYPELPEPYNNLAVIYAQQKQYDKAKQALEMAIRTHPSYATAHENLGDIYARLASQAYDKALQLDSSNASAQTKLAMIRDLMSTGGRTRPAVTGSARPTETRTETAKAEPRPEPKPEPKAEPKPEAKVEAKPAAEPAKPAEAKPADTRPAETKPATPEPRAAESGAGPADVGRAVEGWAAAWSRKDVKGYLAHYAKDFQTPGGMARTAWESERQKRINKPGAILVSVENLSVTQEAPDRVSVKFRQHYKAAALKTSANKVLVLVKRDGKWLIQQERVGN
ncbi:MAG TPA: tetratricopeptide repeat protein [Rhodocyclaceae bacterium]|nr:tetratricopeptide repeat protein [Rhodocyclaceae bacterium]HNH35094.1 tetratricopeptide repeat protein [Rhodocyclaceae bacterium]